MFFVQTRSVNFLWLEISVPHCTNIVHVFFHVFSALSIVLSEFINIWIFNIASGTKPLSSAQASLFGICFSRGSRTKYYTKSMC